MNGIPDRVEPGNLVGEELDAEHDERGPDDRRVIEGLELIRQRDQVVVLAQTNHRDRGVHVESRGEGERHRLTQKRQKRHWSSPDRDRLRNSRYTFCSERRIISVQLRKYSTGPPLA